MGKGIYLGKVWGIPIRLHLSWFIIFGMVTWSLASGYFPEEYPILTTSANWIIAAITSLLFALSVLLHELSHAYIAIHNKVPVREITLFIFGGVAEIEQEPQTARAEFGIALAGPAASLLLAILFGGLLLLSRQIAFLSAPFLWLARMNLLLAGFNMIPGFPLDGGRVLRAIVWKLSDNIYRATRIAAYSGQLIAFGFISFGIFTIFAGNLFNGIWLAFIGWFLQNAAATSIAQFTVQQSLRGVKVSQVMFKDLPTIPWHMQLDRIIEEQVLPKGSRIFLVTDNTGDYLRGMLTLRGVTAIPRERWSSVSAEEVMIPRKMFIAVEPDTELLEALKKMDDANVNQIPVMENDEVIGILTRQEIVHYIRLRSELGF
jgi:Zn-dependent protease